MLMCTFICIVTFLPILGFSSERAMDYDRAKEVKAFDESKAGVKGLLDSGVKRVPKIFIRPQDDLVAEKLKKNSKIDFQIPVIDLSSLQVSDGRKGIIQQVLLASKKWGFFQVINHGIPQDVLDQIIVGIRAFHEQDEEKKKVFYSHDYLKKVKYDSNYDLFRSQAANWRDTLMISMLVWDQIDTDELPQVCRASAIEYINHVTNLAHTLFELLSEALDLKVDYLNSVECAKGKTFAFHYYPPCPEPDLTLGITKHRDASFITILLQDQLGGLQVVHENQWVDVQPILGSLVVNIGDLLQIISNDKFKSVEHRVVANIKGPRISAASFFAGAFASPRLYGPIKELLSEENPQLYKEFTVSEFIANFFSRPLDTTGLDLFKV